MISYEKCEDLGIRDFEARRKNFALRVYSKSLPHAYYDFIRLVPSLRDARRIVGVVAVCCF